MATGSAQNFHNVGENRMSIIKKKDYESGKFLAIYKYHCA